MLRGLLNEAITTVANQVLPQARGDTWQSENFVVFFDRVDWVCPTFQVDNDLEWEIFASLDGEVSVYIYTDAVSPLDLTTLMIALQLNPILTDPDPTEVEAGNYAIKMLFKPTEMRDVISGERVVPILRGRLEHTYILKRTNYGHQQ